VPCNTPIGRLAVLTARGLEKGLPEPLNVLLNVPLSLEDSRSWICKPPKPFELLGTPRAHRPHRAPTALFLLCISSRRLWNPSRASHSL